VYVGEGAEELREMAAKLEKKAENNSAYSTYGDGYNEGLREAAKTLRRRAARLDRARTRCNRFSSTVGE
jgi:hypothetical protein